MRTTPDILIRKSGNCPLASIEFLELRKTSLDCLDSFETCQALETLILSQNLLKNLLTTDGDFALDNCHELAYLDVSSNKLESLRGIESFAALAHLNLDHNCLTLEELARLRKTAVLELYCQNNPFRTDDDELSAAEYRLQVITLLPRVVTLDGTYVSYEERQEAETYCQDLPPSCSFRKLVAKHTRSDTISLRLPGKFSAEFLQVLREEPRRPPAQDLCRLRFLLRCFERTVRLFRAKTGAEGELYTRAYPAPFRLLQRLPEPQQLDFAVTAVVVLYFHVPRKLFQDALAILFAGFVDRKDSQALALLPPFMLTAVISLLKYEHLQKLEPSHPEFRPRQTPTPQEEMNEVLWRTLPVVSGAVIQISRDDFERIARRASLLLSRSPLYPSLISASLSRREQKMYLQLLPLLQFAGMAKDDLSLEDSSLHAATQKSAGDTIRLTRTNDSGGGGGVGKSEVPGADLTLGKPSGNPEMLPWNTEESPMRNYRRPWQGDPMLVEREEENEEEEEEEFISAEAFADMEDDLFSPTPRSVRTLLQQHGDSRHPKKPYRSPGRAKADPSWKLEDGQNSRKFHNVRCPTTDDWVILQNADGPDQLVRVVKVFAEYVQILPRREDVVRYRFKEWSPLVVESARSIPIAQLIWDPRGCWRFAVSGTSRRPRGSIRLFRPANSFSRSGASFTAFLPNVAGAVCSPKGTADTALKPLRLYSVNSSWMSNFVLAPPALVDVHNDLTRQQHDGAIEENRLWSGIENADYQVEGQQTDFEDHSRDVQLAPARSAVPSILVSHIESEVLEEGEDRESSSVEFESADIASTEAREGSRPPSSHSSGRLGRLRNLTPRSRDRRVQEMQQRLTAPRRRSSAGRPSEAAEEAARGGQKRAKKKPAAIPWSDPDVALQMAMVERMLVKQGTIYKSQPHLAMDWRPETPPSANPVKQRRTQKRRTANALLQRLRGASSRDLHSGSSRPATPDSVPAQLAVEEGGEGGRSVSTAGVFLTGVEEGGGSEQEEPDLRPLEAAPWSRKQELRDSLHLNSSITDVSLGPDGALREALRAGFAPKAGRTPTWKIMPERVRYLVSAGSVSSLHQRPLQTGEQQKAPARSRAPSRLKSNPILAPLHRDRWANRRPLHPGAPLMPSPMLVQSKSATALRNSTSFLRSLPVSHRPLKTDLPLYATEPPFHHPQDMSLLPAGRTTSFSRQLAMFEPPAVEPDMQSLSQTLPGPKIQPPSLGAGPFNSFGRADVRGTSMAACKPFTIPPRQRKSHRLLRMPSADSEDLEDVSVSALRSYPKVVIPT